MRRSARTWVFAALAVGLGFGLYLYLFGAHGFGQTSAPRLNVPGYGGLALCVLLLGVLALAFDGPFRDRRALVADALHARPFSNFELHAGRLLAVAFAVWLALVVLALLVLTFESFMAPNDRLFGVPEPAVGLATFVLLDAPPALLFWGALTTLLGSLLRSSALTLLVAASLLAAHVVALFHTPLYLLPVSSGIANLGLAGSDILPRTPGLVDFGQRAAVFLLALAWLLLASSRQPRRDALRPALWGATFAIVGFGTLGALAWLVVGERNERRAWAAAHEAEAPARAHRLGACRGTGAHRSWPRACGRRRSARGGEGGARCPCFQPEPDHARGQATRGWRCRRLLARPRLARSRAAPTARRWCAGRRSHQGKRRSRSPFCVSRQRGGCNGREPDGQCTRAARRAIVTVPLGLRGADAGRAMVTSPRRQLGRRRLARFPPHRPRGVAAARLVAGGRGTPTGGHGAVAFPHDGTGRGLRADRRAIRAPRLDRRWRRLRTAHASETQAPVRAAFRQPAGSDRLGLPARAPDDHGPRLSAPHVEHCGSPGPAAPLRRRMAHGHIAGDAKRAVAGRTWAAKRTVRGPRWRYGLDSRPKYTARADRRFGRERHSAVGRLRRQPAAVPRQRHGRRRIRPQLPAGGADGASRAGCARRRARRLDARQRSLERWPGEGAAAAPRHRDGTLGVVRVRARIRGSPQRRHGVEQHRPKPFAERRRRTVPQGRADGGPDRRRGWANGRRGSFSH